MGSTTALAVFFTFILAGFVIEARGRKTVTHAVLLPLLWMVISASRSISQWLGLDNISSGDEYIEANIAGSPVDRMILTIVIVCGIMIIYKRREIVVNLFRNNKALLAFTIYLGISFLWSDIPEVSFRRWVRLVGDIVMATVLMTEPVPLESIRSVFRRCAYLLIPLSIMLIKYFPNMGVDYGRWSGVQSWVGVALQKNGLGHLCFAISFFLVWDLISNWGKKVEMKFSRTILDLIVLVICVFLLKGPEQSYSSTSLGCLVLGMAILAGSRVPIIKRNFGNMGLSVMLGFCLFFVLDYSFSITELIVSALGRNMTFTDRLPLWNALVDIGLRQPLLGYGYGGFWTVERIETLRVIGGEFVASFNQGHSGYLQLFVEGGFVGIILLGVLLISVFRKIQRTVVIDYEYAVFRLSFLGMILLANVTESSFPSGRSLLTFVFLIVALNDEPFREGANGNGNLENNEI